MKKKKLPKSVHDDLLNLKNKTIERLSVIATDSSTLGSTESRAAVTLSSAIKGFNTSKLIIFLITFFALLAFILWLTSPSQEDDGDQNANEAEKHIQCGTITFSSSSTSNEDGKRILMMTSAAIQQPHQQQQHQITRRRTDRHSPPSSLSSKYQIDTIYESLAEVYEEKRSTITTNDMNVRETKEMLIRQTREELIKTIQQKQQLKQQQQKQLQLKDASPTADMVVDRILNDLVADDMENYAYNKHDRRGLSLNKQDSINNKTDSNESKTSTGSQNSLLSLYNVRHVNAIEDRFHSLSEVSEAIKEAGLEKGQLIFGIDFTISNLENGARTFGGRSLHHYEEGLKNPYQKVIEIMGKTLEIFDLDGRIPAFGFGDAETKDRKVFSFTSNEYCNGFQDVLNKYNEILKNVVLSGPTNFGPLIKQAIKIVRETKQYHILVIVADGQVTNERQTREAIVEASKYPLSIIMVGVGDGPWDTMNEFDDSLPKRAFDNFQFVNYHEVCDNCPDNPDEAFALHALMEIPDQYKAIKELRLLEKIK